MADEMLDAARPEWQPSALAGAPGTGESPGGRRRRWWWLAVRAALALVVGGVGAWQGLSESGTAHDVLTGRTARPAPAFHLPVITEPSTRLSLASFRGRDVLVNFWASLCVPCRGEMPLLESSYCKLAGTVDFVGIDTNDTPTVAQAFLSEVHVTYPVISDQDTAVARTYGIYDIPTTVLVSPSGNVIGRHVGQLHPATLREALKEGFGVSSR